MKEFYVYGLFEPKEKIDSCFYIGKGTGYRMKNHFWNWYLSEEATGSDEKIDKIKTLQENGKNPYSSKIADGLSEDKAYELEEFLIEEIGRENLTNDIPGGKGPFSGKDHPMYGRSRDLNKETRQKISKSLSGRTLSEEHKRKISESRMGEDNPMSGNEEAIEKMASSLTGRNLSEDHKRKIGNSNRESGTLTKLQIKEIRYLATETNLQNKEIADRYPACPSTVSRIKTGDSWGSIKGKVNPNK